MVALIARKTQIANTMFTKTALIVADATAINLNQLQCRMLGRRFSEVEPALIVAIGGNIAVNYSE